MFKVINQQTGNIVHMGSQKECVEFCKLFEDDLIIKSIDGYIVPPEGCIKPIDHTKPFDNINPHHYRKGKIECIDAIESATTGKTGFEGALVANIIKYLWRYEEKNGLEDVKKTQWYINKLVQAVQEREENND